MSQKKLSEFIFQRNITLEKKKTGCVEKITLLISP